MRKKQRSFVVFTLLLGVAACASDVPVSTTFDPLERFPAEARWRWDDTRNVLPEDERIVAMDLGPVVKQAVSAELAARGYQPAGSSTSDYVVSFQLRLDSRIRAEGSFAIGSLSLLMSDAKSGRRVWMGFAQTEVHVSRPEEEREARIRGIVRRMLENFPPGSGG